MAKYYPRRLSSLIIGGWDIVNGAATAIPPGIDMPPSFDWLFNTIGAMAPELVEWVTPDAIPGLSACWDAVSELEGAEAAVLTAGVPVLLWNGRDDPYHDPMKAFATANNLRFLSTQGDHIKAIMVYGREIAKGIAAFIDAA